MTARDGHAVDLDTELARSRDKQVGLRWPVAVDERLDRLVTLAEQAGERTNRKELIAALIATSASDGAALGRTLRRYRTMTVRNCLPGVDRGAQVVRLIEHRPGPRPR